MKDEQSPTKMWHFISKSSETFFNCRVSYVSTDSMLVILYYLVHLVLIKNMHEDSTFQVNKYPLSSLAIGKNLYRPTIDINGQVWGVKTDSVTI